MEAYKVLQDAAVLQERYNAGGKLIEASDMAQLNMSWCGLACKHLETGLDSA